MTILSKAFPWRSNGVDTSSRDEEHQLYCQHRQVEVGQEVTNSKKIRPGRNSLRIQVDCRNDSAEAQAETAFIETYCTPRNSLRQRGGTTQTGPGRTVIVRNSLLGGGLFIYVISMSRAVFQVDRPNQLHESTLGWQLPGSDQLTWSMKEGIDVGMSARPSNKRTLNTVAKSPALRFIHERPKIDHPPVYLAIPTVPREGNPNYLFRVLQSLRWSGFPLHHVCVFYNGKPDEDRHLLWEESEMMFSSQGVNFLWNDAPVPKIHPSVTNSSIPFPDYVDPVKDEEVKVALTDSRSRREWRRKECYDFQLISKHMLGLVYDGVDLQDPVDVGRRNASWVIFNQDDGEWKKEFYHTFHLLQSDDKKGNNRRYDLHHSGLVSVAFRADTLSQIVDYADRWCDFKPVDWMIWNFFREFNLGVGQAPNGGFVNHIGKVSTRAGRVDDPGAGSSRAKP